MSKFAWVTLTTNDTYSLGALVLAHSLKRSGTAHQLAVLVTPTVSDAMRDRLKDVYNLVQEVNVLDSQDAANLALLARPELGVTFTKLHCWRLEQYEKCVFLDADTLVLKNCDELFEREELSAAPDVSWPDCFNSGVFVFKPSLDTFNKITEFAIKHGSFDGGDQGLLNQYFADWSTADIKKHLPFVYNVTAYASYCYLPAFKQFRDKIKILHFAGKLKPWLIPFNSQTKTASTPHDYTHAHDLIQHWWTLFCDNVHNVLDNAMYPCLNITHSADYIEYHDYQYDMDSYYYEHQQQEQQQPRQYVPHVREFRDPWADYYEQAEQAEQQQQQHVAATEPQNVFNHNENANANANKEQTAAAAATNQVHDERTTGHSQSSDACSHIPPTPPTPPPHEPPTEESIAINVNSNVQQNPNPNENHQLQHPEPNTYNIQNPEHNQIAAAVEAAAAEPAVPHEAGLAGALAQLRIGVQRTPEQEHYENLMRRQCWESGQIDYAGADAFENIWKKITQTLEAKTEKTEDAEQTDNANASDNDNDNTTLSSNKLLTQSASQLLQQVSAASSRRSPSPRPAAAVRTEQSSNKTEATTSSRSQHIQQSTSTAAKARGQKGMHMLTSADIEDGKVVVDKKTGASTKYSLIEGGYEMTITTPQPNGTMKTEVKTFWDPKPVSEEDLAKEQANKKLVQKRMNKEIRIDEKTTMLTRAIEGGYEEVYTIVNEDGTHSTKTKTFFDSVPTEINENTKTQVNKVKKNVTRKSSVDSTDSTESSSRRVVQKTQKNVTQTSNGKQSKITENTTIEETRSVSQNIEITENNRTVRKNSLQEQSVKAITQSTTDGGKKKTKKTKTAAPPPPADFVQNETTTVTSKRVPGGQEYTYSTELESGKTITTSKTVYEEEEVELTEEEIKQYKKMLKEAEKHKNVTTTKKLKSESGTKKIVPSENEGDVTTVETIKIQGGTEYHYTTVTSEGIVKKAVKTVYDPVPCSNPDETDEEEIIEEYEEEIIEPGEKNVKTIETVKQLPTKFEEEVTITHEKKEKKVKKSMVISQ